MTRPRVAPEHRPLRRCAVCARSIEGRHGNAIYCRPCTVHVDRSRAARPRKPETVERARKRRRELAAQSRTLAKLRDTKEAREAMARGGLAQGARWLSMAELSLMLRPDKPYSRDYALHFVRRLELRDGVSYTRRFGRRYYVNSDIVSTFLPEARATPSAIRRDLDMLTERFDRLETLIRKAMG